MALSGSFSNAYRGYTYQISWSASQSTSGNYSTITCVHKLICASSYSLHINSRSNTCVVNGSSKSFTSAAINTGGGTTITLGTTTHTVNHNSDGTGSFSITGTFNVQATISGTYVSSIVTSGSATLNTIPRASSITSASNITLGNKCSITFTPASSSFYYDIKFSIGSWAASTGLFCPGQTTVYTYNSYTISGTAVFNNTTVYAQLPNSASGTMTATLTTYSSNSTSAQIGTSSKTFTVTIPSDVVPSVGTITLDPVNITTKDGTSRNILVQNKNKLTVSVSGCTAGTGSSIKSYTFSGPGISTTTTSTSATSGTVSNTGTLSYTVTVTDNRGRTASKSATIKCYAYELPSFKSFSAYRCNSDGTANENGTYIKCSFKLGYSPVNGSNNVTVKALHKKSTDTSYSSTSIFTNADVTAGSKILSSFSLDSTYTVYATIVDNYGGSASSTIITIFGASRSINITSDGTGIAFGKMAESTKLLESKYRVKTPGLLSSRDGRTTTDINIASDNEHLGCLESFIVKSGNTGVPSLGDGHVAHFHWDNTGGYDSQLYLKNSTGEMMSRGCNGGTWGSWNAVQYKPVSLYDISTGNIGTITLSQSAANFTYIEIFYTDDNNRQPHSTKILSPNGKYITLSCIEPITNGSEARVYVRTSGWMISGTTMTPGRTELSNLNRGVYGQFYKDAGGTNVDVNVTAKNYIKIFRVLGYA